jgi:hypothetical protein
MSADTCPNGCPNSWTKCWSPMRRARRGVVTGPAARSFRRSTAFRRQRQVLSAPSILERIELPGPCHRHSERPQRVQHLDGAGMLGEHLRQAPIGHRAFIKVGADQRHAAPGQPAMSVTCQPRFVSRIPIDKAPPTARPVALAYSVSLRSVSTSSDRIGIGV